MSCNSEKKVEEENAELGEALRKKKKHRREEVQSNKKIIQKIVKNIRSSLRKEKDETRSGKEKYKISNCSIKVKENDFKITSGNK